MQQPPSNPAQAGMTAKPGEDGRIAPSSSSAFVSLVLLFQPFSLALYSVGAGLVVLAGLVFNLVPLCTPGRPLRSLVKGALIIVVIFIVVTLLALGSALLYSWYLTVR